MADTTDWMTAASCAPYPTDMFFPEGTDDPTAALAVCADCPVRAECFTALNRDRYAIAGGYTPEQRRALREGRPVPPATPKVKTCARCDTPFESPQPAAKYCGDDCRSTTRAEQLRDQSRRREARHPARCKDCRRRFPTAAQYINHRCTPTLQLVEDHL